MLCVIHLQRDVQKQDLRYGHSVRYWGHSSVNITLNRYVHSSMEMKRSNMEKLETIF